MKLVCILCWITFGWKHNEKNLTCCFRLDCNSVNLILHVKYWLWMSMKSLFNFNVHMQQFVPLLDGLLVSQEIKTPPVLIHRWIKTSIRKLRLPQKYKKNKVKWYSPSDAGLLFFVKFGLVLIYLSKDYRRKSSLILLRKKMFN